MIEENLLGQCLKDAESSRILIEKVTEHDFVAKEAKELYRYIKKQVENNATVSAHLLYHDVPNLKEYISRIENQECEIDSSIERLITISKYNQLKQIQGIIQKPKTYEDIEIQIEEMEKMYTQIIGRSYTKVEPFLMSDQLMWHIEEIQKGIKGETVTGITTGFPKLDKLSGKLREGELWTIAGRPGMGKTSFALTMYVHQAIKGLKPAYFSLEVSKKEIYDKTYSILSEIENNVIPYHFIREPIYNKSFFDNMMIYANKLKQTSGTLCINSNMTYATICNGIRSLKRKGMIDIAYIDQLTLLVRDQSKEKEELSTYTRGFKRLAGELQIPIVELTQLSRKTEDKGMPSLSHLKGSGTIEEDSDVVLFPFRPCVIDKDADKKDSMLIIGKMRNAEGRNIKMDFSTQTTLFKESEEAF